MEEFRVPAVALTACSIAAGAFYLGAVALTTVVCGGTTKCPATGCGSIPSALCLPSNVDFSLWLIGALFLGLGVALLWNRRRERRVAVPG